MDNKLKILNLYSGLGGNRKLWGDTHEITAVEYDESIAAVYQDYFPNDKVIVADAHEYLLKHYGEFDFIWSSPPCPSHSDIRRVGVHRGQNDAIYPEMSLYQEIILLKHFAPLKTKWLIENVKPYYKPLIPPTVELHRHLFWSNFYIPEADVEDKTRKHNNILGTSTIYGFNIKDTDIENKRKVMRNMVDPKVGEFVFQQAFKKEPNTLL